MNFRRVIIFIILTIMVIPLYSAEKWRIAVADLNLISVKDDYNIDDILSKSIVNQLSEVTDFKILSLEQGFKEVLNRSDALQQGRLAEADVMIYGSYYIQNDKLIFFIEILDVLHDKIKLRDYYTGDLSLDLFDTIDEVSARIVKSVREALPEFTVEDEVEINKVRQTVYKSQELKLKRMFSTHLGLNSEIGNKNISFIQTNSSGNSTNNYSGRFPSSQMELGMTIRFANIRLDGALTGLIGVPGYYPFDPEQKLVYLESPGFGRISLSWYPRFLNDDFAIGAGLNNFQPFLGTNNYDDVFGITRLENSKSSLTVFLFAHPSPRLELEASVKLPVFDNNTIEYTATNQYSEYGEHDQEIYKYKVPAITLSMTWFPRNNFGIKARVYYERGEYFHFYTHNGNAVDAQDRYIPEIKGGGPDITVLSLYLGVVYKADFL